MLEVMIKLGETVFQSNEVSGAVWSGVLELERSAKGVSFVTPGSLPCRLIELLWDTGLSEGKDHNRR